MFFLSTTTGPIGSNDRRGNRSGALYFLSVLGTPLLSPVTVKRITMLPPSVTALDRTPSASNYGNRTYLVGGHSLNIMIDEEFRCVRQSIAAPDVAPTVAVGAGTTPQICYTRFYDEITGERSPLSDGTSVTGDLNRAWTQLPTEVPTERVTVEGTATFAAGVVTGVSSNYCDLRPGDRVANAADLTRWTTVRSVTNAFSMTVDDTGFAGAGISLVARTFSRASHVEQWVSVFGGLPRMATRVRLGTTSITEATATLALGIAETLSFTAMPRGDIQVFYNDRQIVAGVDNHRDTAYLSAIGFPERWEGLQFVTQYNEPIIGMLRMRDYVLLLCPGSSYKLQGYTEDDYVRSVLEPDIGSLGHHCNKLVEGRGFIFGSKGVNLFNGAFHPAIPTRRTEFLDVYGGETGQRVAFEEGFSAVNENDQTIQFYPRIKWTQANTNEITGVLDLIDNFSITGPQVWVGHYAGVSPNADGSLAAPEWTSDSPVVDQNSYATAAAYLRLPGDRVGAFYRGTQDGKVYVEDPVAAYNGSVVWQLAPLHFDDFGGSQREGKILERLWSYILSEGRAGELWVWRGDEYAAPKPYAVSAGGAPILMIGDHLIPGGVPRVFALRAGFKQTVIGGNTYEFGPEIVRESIVELAGRMFTLEYRYTNVTNLQFFGVGGVYALPGDAARDLVGLAPGGG